MILFEGVLTLLLVAIGLLQLSRKIAVPYPTFAPPDAAAASAMLGRFALPAPHRRRIEGREPAQ